MLFPVYNTQGQKVNDVELPEEIFGIEVNVGLMHQAYVRQMANARQANAHTKTRAEVNLTGAKWYRQKGIGRARHGARSAPNFVKGGRAHGPRNNRNYKQSMPKTMRRKALCCALSALVRDEQLVLVDNLNMDAPKTRLMQQTLKTVAKTDNVLVLVTPDQRNTALSVANIDRAMYLNVNYLNIRDLLSHEKVVLSLDALESIKRHLGRQEASNG